MPVVFLTQAEGPNDHSQCKDIHPGGPGRLEGPGTGLQGRPRGPHIVHQQHPLALHQRPAPRRHLEGAGDIAGPGGRPADWGAVLRRRISRSGRKGRPAWRAAAWARSPAWL